MSKELVNVGINKETANWLNSQQDRMEKGTKLIMEIALSMGEVLIDLQTCHSGTFAEWIEKHTNIPTRTAYRYMSLFNYKNQICSASNLTEAYKMIETLEAQKKQKETAKAYKRVDEYNKTGVKPEGWRRGTDDKLAKEESERDARIEKVKQETEKHEEEKQKIKQEQDKYKNIDWDAEIEKTNKRAEQFESSMNEIIEAIGKRAAFKEKIKLSQDGQTNPFQDFLIDYFEAIEDDNRRLIECNDAIKIIKKIANKSHVSINKRV